MSTAALSALEPLAATGAGTGASAAEGVATGSTPAAAAAERVQQLQALVAEVERGAVGTREAGGPGGTASAGAGSPTFAAALDAAQAETASTQAAVTTTVPADGAYEPAAAAGEDTYPALAFAQGTPGLDAHPADAATATSAAAYTDPAAAPTGSLSPAASTYAPLIDQAAARYGVEPSLLAGLIQQESGFDPTARSSAGALGLTQLMPGTATSLGVAEPLDPAQSIAGGARYLAQLLAQFGGNTTDALAAYNAGPGAVQQYGGVPPYPETQQYVADVLGYATAFRQSGQLAASPAPYGAGGVQGAATAPTAAAQVPA